MKEREIANSEMKRGVYLVVDPSVEKWNLLYKIGLCANEGIAAVQLWDNFNEGQHIEELIGEVCAICHRKDIPVLINNRWEFLTHTPLDGVHFDDVPVDFDDIRKVVGRPFITGITCNNDVEPIAWAARSGLDYISFCSVFPSKTSNSCDLVDFDTIRQARDLCDIPIYLAGGVNPENMEKLHGLPYHGVAVVSGVMGTDDPVKALRAYQQQFK